MYGGVKRDSVTRVTPRICIFFIFLFVNRYNRLVFRSEADEGFSAKVFATSWLLVLACGVMIALTYSLPLRQMIEQWVSRIVF